MELVIPPIYYEANDFSEGLALVGNMFINKLGETIISCDFHYKNIESFQNGIARCEYNHCTPGKDNTNDEITKYCIGYNITRW